MTIVPRNPALFSAWGMLTSDLEYSVSHGAVIPLDGPARMAEVRKALAELEATAAAVLRDRVGTGGGEARLYQQATSGTAARSSASAWTSSPTTAPTRWLTGSRRRTSSGTGTASPSTPKSSPAGSGRAGRREARAGAVQPGQSGDRNRRTSDGPPGLRLRHQPAASRLPFTTGMRSRRACRCRAPRSSPRARRPPWSPATRSSSVDSGGLLRILEDPVSTTRSLAMDGATVEIIRSYLTSATEQMRRALVPVRLQPGHLRGARLRHLDLRRPTCELIAEAPGLTLVPGRQRLRASARASSTCGAERPASRATS